MESGHVDVFNYGFSYFLHALNEHQIIMNTKQKEMAIAFRIARNSDKSEWRKYLKRK